LNAGSASFVRGGAMRASTAPRNTVARATTVKVTAEEEVERLRLNNLKPLPGSRRKEQRKGRGRAAGQGLTCGYGNRGQKSRSGPGVRPGFEGGQNPGYRAMPKLKGIAGGMASAVPKFITINLRNIESFNLAEGTEVSLETLKTLGKLKPTGAEAKLPLKILGDGELAVSLKFAAAAFSESAKAKIEAAGGSVEVLAQKEKWTRVAHEARVAAAASV
jgi:large subunit ribosomal protein L15